MKEVTGYQDYEMNELGDIFRKKSQHKLTPRKCTNGYMKVTIANKTEYVHRLIGATLLDKPEGNYQINHKNGIKHDNTPSNLEWVTPKQNTQHAIAMGLSDHRKGVIAIHEDGYQYEFESINECAKFLCMNRRSIYYYMNNGQTNKSGYKFQEVK